MSDVDPYEPTLRDKVLLMQEALIAQATQDASYPGKFDYDATRLELLQNPTTKDRLPGFVKRCRTLSHFWQFIKFECGTYAERRKLIWDSFSPILDHLELAERNPSDDTVAEILTTFNPDAVHLAWQKALNRRTTDPEGAVTAARTLLETVCKHLLEEMGKTYPDHADLAKLWSLCAETLNLAPNQHQEQVFKSILGNCQSIVGNLGAIRNKIGDAHGTGRRPVRPKPRHAELAVNLAGTMAAFLVASWKELPPKPPQDGA